MRVIMRAFMLLVAGQLSTHAQEAGLVEPQAGTWKTWVIDLGHAIPTSAAARSRRHRERARRARADRGNARWRRARSCRLLGHGLAVLSLE